MGRGRPRNDLPLDHAYRDIFAVRLRRKVAEQFEFEKDFALEVGCGANTVNRLCRAKAWPSMGLLYRICVVLHCHPGELLPCPEHEECREREAA